MIRRSLFVPNRSTARPPEPKSAEPKDVYSTNDLAAAFNVSLRQLQWWDERHVIQPRHYGHRRVYSPGEALLVSIVAALRRRGLSLQKIRRIVKKVPAGIAGQIMEEKTPLLVLGTDARDVAVLQPDQVVGVILMMKAPAIVLNLNREFGPLLFGTGRDR